MTAGTGAEVDGLTVRHGDVVAVRDLSLTARAGEVTCLVGPNGAGKTSTVETLEGFARPAAGRVAVLGLDPVRDRRRLAPRMGAMLQEVGIHPAVRVGEAARHAAALYPRAHDPGELLDRVGLAGLERRTFRRLSGGEQRRLALALALAGRPEVVFLDEPTAGVDPAGRVTIRELVAGLRDEGVTVLLSSHELDEVERLADRVVMIDRGRPVADGTVPELTRGTGTGGVAGAVRFRARPGLDVDALAGHLASEIGGSPGEGAGAEGPADAPGVRAAETGAGDYVVEVEATPAAVAALTAWLAGHDAVLQDLRTGHRTLEEVFLALVGPASGAGASGRGGEPGSRRRRDREARG